MDHGVRVDDSIALVLTAAEVAELLRLNVDYVRLLSRRGVLPSHRVPGGRVYRYLPDEILGWLAEQPGGSVPKRGP